MWRVSDDFRHNECRRVHGFDVSAVSAAFESEPLIIVLDEFVPDRLDDPIRHQDCQNMIPA